MTKAELEKFITDRVYPNNAQEITGKGLQEALLAISGEILETPVSYAQQELTPLEKRTARNNIGAGSAFYDVVFLVQGKPLQVTAFHVSSAGSISLSNRFKSFDTPVFFFVQYNTSMCVPLFCTTSDFLTRSGAYITSQGIVKITVKFEVDEENDIINVVSSEQQIIPISSENGTAVSLGTGTASGDFSFSQGTGTASGKHAVSLGTGTASGDFSFSQGTGTASGKHAVSLGTGTASGDFSFSQGTANFAIAIGAIACGRFNRAETAYSAVFGKNSKSIEKASSSIVAGEKAVGEGYQCAVFGKDTNGKGNYTVVGGIGTVANNSAEVAFGQYNQSDSDTAFSIGNGNSTTRKNLVEIKKNGDVYINGKKVILTFEE